MTDPSAHDDHARQAGADKPRGVGACAHAPDDGGCKHPPYGQADADHSARADADHSARADADHSARAGADETTRRLLIRVAQVAGAFSLIVGALLAYDYSLRQADDPSETIAWLTLKEALRTDPTNEALKAQFRDLDTRLRADYFRHRVFTSVGAVMLLAGVAVTLIAARRAEALGRRPPEPGPHAPPHDVESPMQQRARWGVAAVAVVLAIGVVVVAVTVPGPFDESARLSIGDQPATDPDGKSGAAPAAADGPTVPTPVPELAEPYDPPTAEQRAAAWARFRGPHGSGVSPFSNIPTTWDAASDQNIRWKTPVPMPGNSSPIVWNKHVFLTGATEDDRRVMAFDADSGKLLWQSSVPGTPQSTSKVPEVLEDTGLAAPTAVTDGQRVFAIFANGDIGAFDFDGRLAWSRSFGIPENMYGHSASLAMHEGLVLVQIDKGGAADDGLSKLYALSAADGSTVWDVDRPVPNSWTSPIVITHEDRTQLITAADPWVIAYNPADGTELWRIDCLKADCGPSPVYAGELVQIGNEYCEWSALRPDGEGDVTETHVAWTAIDGLPDTCSPLATDQFVFLMPSTGYFTCLDAKTGEFVWEREFMASFTSSPSLVHDPEKPDEPGLIYLFNKKGESWVGRPTRDGCEEVATGTLGEPCVTSPAFQPGRIYIRGEKHLFCIEGE